MDNLKPDFETIASQIEMELALLYLKKRRSPEAIEVLKGFERKDASLRAIAATNLAFIYFLEQDYAQAEQFADLAIRYDRYNAKALVNRGNCLYMAGEF